MSLATRCSACGTVFRVVQDQLRVSGGWVRCGRCGEVFNAVESLVDLELDRVGEDVTPSVHESRVMQDLARVAGQPPFEPGSEPPQAVSAVPEAVPGLAPTTELSPPDADVGAGPQHDEVDDLAATSGASEPAEPAADPFLPAAEPMERDAPMRPPSFVRSAERAARWRRPHVRAMLALLVVCAAGALTWQLAATQHDVLAARWPALQPWLERVCAQAGCQLQPLMRIDALSVESSGLLRSGPPGAYRLQVVLRSRERVALRMPHMELSLTDALGQTLSRRVLTPAQLGASGNRIDAGAEVSLATTLRTKDARVVGYTIEIFYP
ncbi:MAG: zinc-ribbon domain-containing protein [Rubrivivax sp.]|nr:zinc-ribbon domain-containing protein [Rubrivivax sp.]MDH5339843.1 zinc-ribbon domain-containing protein [Rubrivivax sp.]